MLVVVDRFQFMTLRALKTGSIFKKKMAHGMVTLLCLNYSSQKLLHGCLSGKMANWSLLKAVSDCTGSLRKFLHPVLLVQQAQG